ncbi:MurR/RpiR family transcriptional regulator [Labrys okinawensis]|uniref:MurR/RpiR family transcriptional regulator n=1 Tax=Labrys okinawensis TaxID=346911 RepID=UPI0039BD49AC
MAEIIPVVNKDEDRAAFGYSRPESYEELRAVLSSGTVRLPNKLRQVAIYLWQHPTVVALGTVTSLAEQVGVQPSTLVRFAQTFGYSGFSDLQDIFKAYIRSGQRDAKGASPSDGQASTEAATLVDGFVKSSTVSLSRVTERLDLQAFEAMAAALAAAKLVYIVGSKRAFSVSSYVSLALSKLDIRNITVDNVGSAAFEHMRLATPADAVLAISFTPYNSITPELAASAGQRGVPILSITDSAFSPLVPLSKAYVEVVEEDFSGFKSLAATLSVAMALVLRVAQLRGAEEEDASSRGKSSTMATNRRQGRKNA